MNTAYLGIALIVAWVVLCVGLLSARRRARRLLRPNPIWSKGFWRYHLRDNPDWFSADLPPGSP